MELDCGPGSPIKTGFVTRGAACIADVTDDVTDGVLRRTSAPDDAGDCVRGWLNNYTALTSYAVLTNYAVLVPVLW